MNESGNREIRTFSSRAELCTGIAEQVSDRILENLSANGQFHLALTGGSVGGLVTDQLINRWNKEPQKFHGLHIWWSDERFVAEASQERNALTVFLHLRSDSGIHTHYVLSSDAGVDLDTAAARYKLDVAGIDMDLTLLGVGEDGHVASIFPGVPFTEAMEDVLAVKGAPKLPALRISFSLAKINESVAIWLLAAGASKREAVARLLANDADIPAAHVYGRQETILFVDHSAYTSE